MIVAKTNKKQPKKTKSEKAGVPLNQPWISMRKAVIVIAITSVLLAALTAWQVAPSEGWLKGILWGLFFGGLIWIIFFGNVLVNRFLRRK